MEREILNVRQAAQYLGITRRTLCMYASLKSIPGFKVGNRWLFRKTDIRLWVDEQVRKNGLIPSKTP